jgi:7,8-dihydropterin-6-yl-methyl-4-(beta-D-ribofuranosyl)aminobenzene 5'-phosphate synthase
MWNPLRITLLVDHQADDPALATEHGLSLLLEAGERRILFDTGASGAFLRNADRLGLVREPVRHVVLSHGHRDHAGGLGFALERWPEAQVYLHPRALGPRFSRHPGRPVRELGFPRESWSAICPIVHSHANWTTAPMRLVPGIGVTGPVPRRHPEEACSGPFFLDAEGCRPDPFEDDQALWVRTTLGLVVVLGCAHAGVVNTLEHIQGITGESRIQAVLGGFHLLGAAPERLRFTVQALQRMGIPIIRPVHCSGTEEVAHLHAHLGDRVRPLPAGESLVLEETATVG